MTKSETLEDRVKDAEGAVERAYDSLESIHQVTRELEDSLREAFLSSARTFNTTVNQEDLESFIKEFIKKPYFVIQRSEREWWLVVPKYITLEFGFLLAQDGAWNIFAVNQYADMIQDVPEEFKQEISLSRPFDGVVIDGDDLILARPELDDIQDVKARYSDYLGRAKDKKTITIKKGKIFELTAALIRDGILPFKRMPVKKSDLRESVANFELYDYQQKDFDIFMKSGAVGIFYPMGAGKSFEGLEAIARLKGRKLICVPNASVAQNWRDYLYGYHDEKGDWVEPFLKLTPEEVSAEIDIVIYNVKNLPKVINKEYMLLVLDEVATLPADTHIGFGTQVNTKYRMCMTATPLREDGREDLIFALSGIPLGVNWQYFIENNLIKTPKMHVWIDPDLESKFQRCDSLLKKDKKTIIFCDSIDLGNQLAKRYDIPFVSGETKADQRLEIIRESQWVVVSRIGDLGISIKDLQVIIEFDFLYGSRHQETQRVGRLFHSEEEGQYHALVTVHEYIKYRKRFFDIYGKGVSIEWHRNPELPSDLSMYVKKRQTESKRKRTKTVQTPKVPKRPKYDLEELARRVPLSERIIIDKDSIIKILGSEYAIEQGGLSTAHITAIFKANHIRITKSYSVSQSIKYLYKGEKIERRTVKGEKVFFIERK